MRYSHLDEEDAMAYVKRGASPGPVFENKVLCTPAPLTP